MWRLVAEDIATLKEVQSYYDLVEVLDAHTVLDMKLKADEEVAG